MAIKPEDADLQTCRRNIDYGQSPVVLCYRYSYCTYVQFGGRVWPKPAQWLLRNFWPKSEAKPGQPAVLFTQSEVSHSNLRRLVAKVGLGVEMLPTPAQNFAYCWPLPAPSWQSGRQLHPLPLISSLLHGTKNICMSPDP